MRLSLFALFALIIVTFGGDPIDAYAQRAIPLPKRFPWDQRPPKCFLPGAMEMMGVYCAPPPNWPNYGETTNRVERLIIDPDFDLLERAETELGFSRDKFPSGQYYFDAWFLALDTLFTLPSEPLYATASAWAKAKGEDGYVKLAEALMRYGEAWAARGTGYANTVTPEAWDIYRRKLREADQVLDSASDKVKRMGPWHVAKLRVAYQVPELKSSRASLLEAASAAWPDYPPIYTAAMRYSLPKWGGSYEEVDRIARLALERSEGMGASMYVVVYERMFHSECNCTLPESAVDWDLMKKGFRDIEASGQADGYTLKAYANFACQMRDREEARRLLQLSDRLRIRRGAEPPDPCREFAFSPT